MSADAWKICPRCLKKRKAEILKADIESSKAYGTVPLEEWQAMREAATSKANIPLGETFREDYEQGIATDYNGIPVSYYVIYSGHCTVCDFGFDYNYQKELTP